MWPDHGAPEEVDFKSIGKILESIKGARRTPESKIVIHCSAGIGRTGSILAIYNMQISIELLIRKYKESSGKVLSAEDRDSLLPRVSVFGTVRRLREQRFSMV